MKRINLILGILLMAYSMPAQQVFKWIENAGGNKQDVVSSIVSFNNEIYITGHYFSSFNTEGKEITSNGASDIYLARLDAEGKTEWIRNIGGEGEDEATCLITDNEHLYLAGLISGSVEFEKKIYEAKGKSIFVSQTTKNGKPDWFKKFGYEGHATLDVLSNAPNENLLLGGMLYGTLDTGEGILESKGKSRAYYITLNSEGEYINSALSYGNGNHRLISGTFDKDGNQYLLFSISGKFNLGSGESFSTSGNVSSGLVLIKTSNNNKILWEKCFECSDYSEGVSVITNSEGDIFTCINFSESLTSKDVTLTNNGQLETAVMCFNPEGKLNWSKKIGSPVKSRVMDAVITNSQELLVTGYFRNQVEIGDISEVGENRMGDLFLLQFDNEGNPAWFDKPGEDASSFGKTIALDQSGNIVLAGGFSGEIHLNGEKLKSNGKQDILVAKYYNCGQNKVSISDDSPLCVGSEKELKASGKYISYVWNDSVFSESLIINKPGTYYVKAMDELGCLASDTVVIPEANYPDLWLGEDTTLSVGQEILLAATEGFASYNWDDGFTGQYRAVKYDPAKDSVVFGLNATNGQGCTAVDSVTIKFAKNEFKEDEYFTARLTTYPNPVSEELHWLVSLKKPTSFQVKLTDANGRLVYAKEIASYLPNSVETIRMEDLPAGNYMFSLKTGDSNINRKIVKK